MPLPFDIQNHTTLWKGQPLQRKDLADIREYVDACLQPTGVPVSYNLPITADFKLLLKLVNALDATIPWANKSDSDFAFGGDPIPKSIPHKPKLPEAFNHLETTQDGRDFLDKHSQSIIDLKDVQNLLSNAKKGTPSSIELKKAQRRLTYEFNQGKGDQPKVRAWVTSMEKRDLAIASFEQKYGAQIKMRQRIFEAYPTSVPQKKILKRLVHDLETAIDKGGLSYEKLKWQLLPEGSSLPLSINRYLLASQSRYPTKKYDGNRIKQVIGLKPNKAYFGHDEFDGYLVFLFNHSSYAVLESPWSGNALYLLRKDQWPELSKLSKSVLLHQNSKHARRIIHDTEGNWFNTLKYSLNQ